MLSYRKHIQDSLSLHLGKYFIIVFWKNSVFYLYDIITAPKTILTKLSCRSKIKLSVCDWVWLSYKCPRRLFCENRVQMISYIACSWHIPYDYFTVNFSCFSLLMHISNIQLLCRKGQFEFFWEKKHSPSPGLADCIPRCHFTYSAAVVPVAGHRCLMRYRLLSDMRAVHGWSCPFPSCPIMRHRGSASVFSMWRWSPGSSCQHRLASFSLQF